MAPMPAFEAIPPDLFVSGYPEGIRRQANRLRALVRIVEPAAAERVRPGWRLLAYDLQAGRRARYFAYVALEPIHVHLGFAYGAWMRDPDAVLQGEHLRLRNVRYLTYTPGAPIDRASVLELVREAALVARMTAPERMARVLDRDWSPG
jgi:hypothetical protein